jgi:hypothetical protein
MTYYCCAYVLYYSLHNTLVLCINISRCVNTTVHTDHAVAVLYTRSTVLYQQLCYDSSSCQQIECSCDCVPSGCLQYLPEHTYATLEQPHVHTSSVLAPQACIRVVKYIHAYIYVVCVCMLVHCRLERTAFPLGDFRVLQKVLGGVGEGAAPTAFCKV